MFIQWINEDNEGNESFVVNVVMVNIRLLQRIQTREKGWELYHPYIMAQVAQTI